MKRYHVTLWGHPAKPARSFSTDWLWSACEDYPCISVMRTETIPLDAMKETRRDEKEL